LDYPIDHLTVAENCEPVLRAAKIFEPWNHGVLTNSRTRIYHEDARTVLKLGPQQYDVIISEPSNPWMIGVASVFTREFYQLAASRLKPGGLMTQWFHTYEMDDETITVVLRTFESVFPRMEIWDVGEGDIVLLGSDRAWQSNLEVYGKAYNLEKPRKGLGSIHLETAEAILARRMASQRTAFAIPGPGPFQADDTPILEYTAPRAFFLYHHARGAHQFLRFDERTWQMDLASDQANDELATLDPPALKSIFSITNGSLNEDLMRYLQEHFMQYTGAAVARPIVSDNRAMLCSLQGKNKRYAVYTPPSASTNMLTKQLVQSEYDLRGGDKAKQASAVEAIYSVLQTLHGIPSEGADFSPDYYADLAIKFSLRLGNRAEAKTILDSALQLQPGSRQLAYLSRILARDNKN
jgi:hypothetical protein